MSIIIKIEEILFKIASLPLAELLARLINLTRIDVIYYRLALGKIGISPKKILKSTQLIIIII